MRFTLYWYVFKQHGVKILWFETPPIRTVLLRRNRKHTKQKNMVQKQFSLKSFFHISFSATSGLW